jgi:hypothetical protein
LKQDEFARMITIIAARKTQFFQRASDKLLSSLPKEIDKQAALNSIRTAIAGLDDTLFIGNEEKEKGIINPETSLAKLDLDVGKIFNEILLKLSKSL